MTTLRTGLAGLIVLQLADTTTTLVALSHGGREVSPYAAAALHAFGPLGLFLAPWPLIGIAFGCLAWLPGRARTVCLVIMLAIQALNLAHNVSVVGSL